MAARNARRHFYQVSFTDLPGILHRTYVMPSISVASVWQVQRPPLLAGSHPLPTPVLWQCVRECLRSRAAGLTASREQMQVCAGACTRVVAAPHRADCIRHVGESSMRAAMGHVPPARPRVTQRSRHIWNWVRLHAPKLLRVNAGRHFWAQMAARECRPSLFGQKWRQGATKKNTARDACSRTQQPPLL